MIFPMIDSKSKNKIDWETIIVINCLPTDASSPESIKYIFLYYSGCIQHQGKSPSGTHNIALSNSHFGEASENQYCYSRTVRYYLEDLRFCQYFPMLKMNISLPSFPRNDKCEDVEGINIETKNGPSNSSSSTVEVMKDSSMLKCSRIIRETTVI
uniref:Uncharacterized protein n=1 Tax=Romanomermis culicivorax TaxID=13658 RepID=A0A915LDS6_ROMCU